MSLKILKMHILYLKNVNICKYKLNIIPTTRYHNARNVQGDVPQQPLLPHRFWTHNAPG